MTDPNSFQVGGSHYKTDGKQHWDIVVACQGPGYLIGCATKYLFRWRDKNGVQDLEKAKHYATKLLDVYIKSRFSGFGAPLSTRDIPSSVGRDEATICMLLGNFQWPMCCGAPYSSPAELLSQAIARIQNLIDVESKKVETSYAPIARKAFEDEQPTASQLHPG